MSAFIMSATITHLFLDVDGVLTDGRMWFAGGGESLKGFHARDGHRIRLALRAGLTVGLVSGRDSAALRHRADDLGITPCFLGVAEKLPVLKQYLEREGVGWERVAFVGDDLPDAGLMRWVGLSIAVADGHPSIRARADWVVSMPGGMGAVGAAIERLLRERGEWPPDGRSEVSG